MLASGVFVSEGSTNIDARQIELIIQKHSASLVLYARQWCSSPDDAVQEAFIDFVKLPDMPVDPVAWLFKTARYKALNQTRSDSRRAHHQRQAIGSRDDWFVEPQEHKLLLQELEIELQHLTAIQREIVVAKVWGELSFAQISELVDLSTTTAFRIYREALVILEHRLTGKQSTEPQSKCLGDQHEI